MVCLIIWQNVYTFDGISNEYIYLSMISSDSDGSSYTGSGVGSFGGGSCGWSSKGVDSVPFIVDSALLSCSEGQSSLFFALRFSPSFDFFAFESLVDMMIGSEGSGKVNKDYIAANIP